MSEPPSQYPCLPPLISFWQAVQIETRDRSFWLVSWLGMSAVAGVIAAVCKQHPDEALWAFLLPAALIVARWVKMGSSATAGHEAERQAYLADLERKKQVQELLTFQECIDRHLSALALRYSQTRLLDAYGNVDDRRWHKEIEHFIRTCFVKPENNLAWKAFKKGWKWEAFKKLTYERVEEAAAYYAEHPQASVEGMSGEDFERYCAKVLTKFGWLVRLTSATRDSGADLIAEKNSVRVSIQAKRHTRPVGNKAVQEAYTSKGIYNAHQCAVVATSSFTSQAQTEAHTLNVMLLHYSQLYLLDRFAEV